MVTRLEREALGPEPGCDRLEEYEQRLTDRRAEHRA